MEPKYDLLTMGRSCIDLYSSDIGVPFAEIKSFAAYVGGSPTNIAVGAARLGLRPALLTAVGADPVGDFILHFLQEEGVETKYIPRKPEGRSGAALLGIEPPDRFPLLMYRDNAADIWLSIDDVLAAPVASAACLLVTGTGLSRDPARSATIFACEQARLAGRRVILDFDLRADQWPDLRAYGVAIRSLLPLVDVGIGTEEEIKAVALVDASQLSIRDSQVSNPTVEGDLELAVAASLGRGLPALVVKRGSQGASVFIEDRACLDVPGFPVQVLNILGAGDAFGAGLVYGLRQGWDWYRTVRMANACGAIVVTRHACSNSMPFEQEALEFIAGQGGF